MAEREPRRQRAQPRRPGVVTPREAAAHEAEPTHPILALQRAVGNRAVQLLLMRRSVESSEEWAIRRIRGLLVDLDRGITGDFEAIEKGLRSHARGEVLLPVVRSMKGNHQATGILTLEMIAMLGRAIGPVHPDRDPERYIHTVYLELLGKRVKLKAEAMEALNNDPWQWYLMDFRNRSPLDVPVDHNPAPGS